MFLLKKESVLGLHQEKARNFKFQRCELIDPSVEVCGDRIFARLRRRVPVSSRTAVVLVLRNKHELPDHLGRLPYRSSMVT